MKAVRLTINNIGIIGNTVIDLDKPLILFYGDLMQGKTTILNAFKWCLGGPFPGDIIKHGEKDASVVFEFSEDGGLGSISRSWYVNKEGITTVRPVSFIRAGKPVTSPDKEIKKFLNPYLLDSDFLKKMGETDRKAYFVGLFGVDTSDIDQEILKAVDEAKTLRIEIKAYGDIDLTEITPVDISGLRIERTANIDAYQAAVSAHEKAVAGINEQYQKECDTVDKENRTIAKLNDDRKRGAEKIVEIDDQIETLLSQVERLKEKKVEFSNWIKDNPGQVEKNRPIRPELPHAPTAPDTSDIDDQISEAAAIAVKVEQYQKNLKRAAEKATKESTLIANEAGQRDLKRKKVARLAEAGEKSGINELIFNEDGSFTYDGTSAAMLSTSQVMSLSQELSALYPSGFGLDLIDRAESLGFAIGKNIIEFVEKAKRENKTILASIVGERPAVVPPEVGVFVVDQGVVK